MILELPAGQPSFTGETARELIALVGAGTIRVTVIPILVNDEDGSSEAMESSDLEELSELRML